MRAIDVARRRHSPAPRPFLVALLSASIAMVACGDDGGGSDTGPDDPLRCNGHEVLCDRPLNEVAFPSTHNSMSNAEDDWSIPNQNNNIEQQLTDGVRGFLIDVHEVEGDLFLCHTSCLLGERPLDDALTAYREFLEQNPHEVLIFIIQDEVATAPIAAEFEKTGLDAYAYSHEDGEEWPTLRSLIEADKRLLVTLERGDRPPAYMRRFWDIGWDTPYSFSSIEDFNCDVNRGTKGNDLFLVNHWLSTPLSSADNARKANTYEVLSARVAQCQEQGGQLPNLVAVDFYDIGALFRVVDELNGVAVDDD